MKDVDHMQNIDLSADQQEFIRRLREMAEDTPVPMALQPDMILARLSDKPKKLGLLERLRIPQKAITGMAAVMAAFVAVLMTGREPIKQYLNGDGPAVTTPEITVSQPAEEIVNEPVSEPAYEVSFPVEDQPDEPVEVVSEPVSEPAEDPSEPTVVPAEPVDEPVPEPAAPVTVAAEDMVDEASGGILPSGEIKITRTVVVDPNAEAINLPSGEGADYAHIYAALQQAVTPENANHQYETAVLSAGLSADGLGQTSGQTLAATDGKYFYVSYQDAKTVSIS